MVASRVGGGRRMFIKEQPEMLGDGTTLHPCCAIYTCVQTHGLGTGNKPGLLCDHLKIR